jgi:hypothetical protein
MPRCTDVECTDGGLRMAIGECGGSGYCCSLGRGAAEVQVGRVGVGRQWLDI